MLATFYMRRPLGRSLFHRKENDQQTSTERYAPTTALGEEDEMGCDCDTFDRLNSWPPYCEFVRYIQVNIRPNLFVNTIYLSKMDNGQHCQSDTGTTRWLALSNRPSASVNWWRTGQNGLTDTGTLRSGRWPRRRTWTKEFGSAAVASTNLARVESRGMMRSKRWTG